MLLNAREEKMNAVMNQMAAAVRRPLGMLTEYYSSVLNKKLSTKHTLTLLNAQLGFCDDRLRRLFTARARSAAGMARGGAGQCQANV